MGECGPADIGEVLIARGLRIGVDARQVDVVALSVRKVGYLVRVTWRAVRGLEDERVGPITAGQGIRSRAADKDVVAGTSGELVRGVAAGKVVVKGAPCHVLYRR